MPDTLTGGYMNGPGMKLRIFFRWALRNYAAIGVPQVKILNQQEFDKATIETALEAAIPPTAVQQYQVTFVKLHRYDLEFFVEQHILDNYPERLTWTYTVDAVPFVGARITWAAPYGVGPTTISVPDDDGEMWFYITYNVVQSSPQTIFTKMWCYKLNSGNAVLDGIPQISIPTGKFIPFIPVRLDGEFLSESHLPTTYTLAKKAYKKLTGQKMSKLVEQLQENDDLEDIDHAYIVQGVALNCYENEGKKYLFKLFDWLRTYSRGVPDYEAWRTERLTSYTVTRVLGNHAYASYEGDADAQYNYIYDNSEFQYYPSNRPLTSISLQAEGLAAVAKLWMVIKWSAISKFTGSGQKRPGAQTGDLWWTVGSSYTTGQGQVFVGGTIVPYNTKADDVVELHWQVSDTQWETLQFIGLEHENKVYSKKSVEITAKEALADEDESGFIVPIHYETLRSMSLVESTQMAIASNYLVLNSYQVVKQKWYQTGFFKIVVVVVIIAITVATAGTGTAPAVGILGSAASVGAALGFTGLMATIVGAVANAIAAMILTQLLTKVSTMVFGEKIGMIIAAVASVIAMNVGSTLMSGGSMAQAWGSLMSASNIMSMTSAVGNGIQGYLQAATAEFGMKTQKVLEQYDKDSNNIQKMYLDQFGYGTFNFDATRLTDTVLSGNFESEATFLSRTLMTGTDIADMSLNMLTNFADMTLSLDTIGS
jgi:hypothetical protein